LFACQLDTQSEGNYGANGLDYDTESYKWGYINQKGDEVIAGRFDDCQDFKEGLAAVRIKDQWGYIDNKGTTKIDLQYKAAWSARVSTWDNKMGIIDNKGAWVIPPDWTEVKEFSEGVGIYKDTTTYGYIDKTGTIITPTIFQAAWAFDNGLAKVKKDGKCGFIDLNGQSVIPNKYDQLSKFKEGVVRAK